MSTKSEMACAVAERMQDCSAGQGSATGVATWATGQTLMSILNYLTQSDWDKLEGDGDWKCKVQVIVGRMVLLMCCNPTDKTLRNCIAIVCHYNRIMDVDKQREVCLGRSAAALSYGTRCSCFFFGAAAPKYVHALIGRSHRSGGFGVQETVR